MGGNRGISPFTKNCKFSVLAEWKSCSRLILIEAVGKAQKTQGEKKKQKKRLNRNLAGYRRDFEVVKKTGKIQK